MKKIYTLIITFIGLFLLLLCSVSIYFSDKYLDQKLDLAYASITSLSGTTKEKLRKLEKPVKIKYFASNKIKMPARLSRLKNEVFSLLKVMRRESSNKVAFQIIDPDTIRVPEATAVKKQKLKITVPRGIVSFNVKTVKHDEYSVNTIWSGLSVNYKGVEKLIPNIIMEHLPYLEERIMAILNFIEKPQVIKIAVSGGNKNRIFYRNLANYGKRLPFNIKSGIIPEDAHALILIQPVLNKINTQAIKDFLSEGKNVLVFCSPVKLKTIMTKKGYSKLTFLPQGLNMEFLLKDIGVEIRNELILDERNFKNSPAHVMVYSGGINLNSFKGKRAGKILFHNAAPIFLNPEKLSKEGYKAEILAFTSDKAWAVKVSEKADRPLLTSIPADYEKRGIFNLGVMLQQENSWNGKLAVFSTEYLFSDSSLSQGPGNNGYLKNMLNSFILTDNVFSAKQNKKLKTEIRSVGKSERLIWRLFAVFFVPSFIFFLLFFKFLPMKRIKEFPAVKDILFFLSPFLVPLTIAIIIFALPQTLNPDMDLTEGKINSTSVEAEEFIKNSKIKINITYITSPKAEMPPDGKKLIAFMLEKLKDIKAVSKGRINYSVLKVSADNNSFESKLQKWGIKTFTVKVIREDLYMEKSVVSALILENEKRTEIVKILDPANYEQTEFIIVSALKRLIDNKKYSIAFMSDQPKLSPAEAFMEYQQRQLSVPKSPDVYSWLREILVNYGFNVINVPTGARRPSISELPTKFDGPMTEESIKKLMQTASGIVMSTKISSYADIVLYLQPFLISDDIKKGINGFLCSGKNVILAAQHFNMQQRKYSGLMYDVVYWPQPQFTRANELLDPYGIEIKREVLFDQSKKDINLVTQVRKGVNMKEEEIQPFASPFVIRALAGNISKVSDITSNLSDQLFISGNRILKIENKFSAGLQWNNLIMTSDKSWANDWKGGWIGEDVLKGGNYFKDKQPLAVLIKGKFPNLYGNYRKLKKEAKLFIIGCSEMFKNSWIMNKEFEHKRFLLNAVIDFTYGSDFAKIHSHASVPKKGIGFVDPQNKARIRLFVIFFFLRYYVYTGCIEKFSGAKLLKFDVRNRLLSPLKI